MFGADHVYRMDPEQMVQFHIESGAGVTVAGIRVPRAEATAFGCIDADESGRIREFLEKPADPPGTPDDPEQTFASMGNYIFTTKVLVDAIRADAEDDDSDHDMGGDIIPRLVARRHGGGVRLQRQRGARRHRARPRLLARRRHARRVLRRAHGSGVGAPGVQPLQPALADPGRAGEPRARQVRQRRLRAGVGGRRGQHHLGGVRAQFGAVVQRA